MILEDVSVDTDEVGGTESLSLSDKTQYRGTGMCDCDNADTHQLLRWIIGSLCGWTLGTEETATKLGRVGGFGCQKLDNYQSHVFEQL